MDNIVSKKNSFRQSYSFNIDSQKKSMLGTQYNENGKFLDSQRKLTNDTIYNEKFKPDIKINHN